MKNIDIEFQREDLTPEDRKIFDSFFLALRGGVTIDLHTFLNLSKNYQNLWVKAKEVFDVEKFCITLNSQGKEQMANDLAYKWGLIDLDMYCENLANITNENISNSLEHGDLEFKKI